jgi:predicted dehydrogenase
MNQLRIAVIGAGRLGGFHAQKIVQSPHFKLVGIIDPSVVAREQLAAKYGTSAFDSHKDLFGKIDAAIVASPSSHHFDAARELLAGGVHLLVEKPLATTAHEAGELVEIARRTGVVLQVGHVERFNPAFSAVASCTSDPQYIEAVRSSPFTFRSMDIGAVLDLMIHDIDLVLSLARSPVRKVESTGITIFGGHEDVANARLEFASGCVATLTASRGASESVRRMSVWSAKAISSIDFAARSATIVKPCEAIVSQRFHAQRLTRDETDYYRQHLTDQLMPQQRIEFEAVDALALEVEDFAASILTNCVPRVSGEAGRDAVAVAEQVLAAIAQRQSRSSDHPSAIPLPWVNAASDRKAG